MAGSASLRTGAGRLEVAGREMRPEARETILVYFFLFFESKKTQNFQDCKFVKNMTHFIQFR